MNNIELFKLSPEELATDSWVAIRKWCEARGYNFDDLTNQHAKFRMVNAEHRSTAMAEQIAKQQLPPQSAGQLATLVNFSYAKKWWNASTQTWSRPDMVYIGRAMSYPYFLSASPYGNPFRVEKDTDEAREDAIETYRNWIQLPAQAHLLRGLDALRGKTLVCWCAPRRCHGEVLIELMRAKPGYADVALPEPDDRAYQPALKMDAF